MAKSTKAADFRERLRSNDGISLDLSNSDVEELRVGLRIKFTLNLTNCRRLGRLPDGLQAGSLILAGCVALVRLPEDLRVTFLDISDCPQLGEWPQKGELEAGRLRARNCTGLMELPPWIRQISQLDLRGCANIFQLPETLKVTSWIDIADTGIRSLPKALEGTPLRWKGVPIDERIAFRPHEICGNEVLSEPNAELRRVKLERVGFERFLKDVEAIALDEDIDAGGRRRLLRVELDGDEPLVCVSVICPSTGRQYIIRVPPEMQTCHQAIAWTAGFDNPEDYKPILET